MKKLFGFILGLVMIFSFSSCETAIYATTQDDIYVEAETDVVRESNIDFNIIIRYGRPYYYNGTLLYYLYNNLYYYPFYYDNYWYVRVYRRPFNHLNYRPYFRPNKHDYRFRPGHYRGFDRPNRPEPNYRRHSNVRRPDNQPRQLHPDVGNRRPEQPKVNNNQRPRPNVGVPHTPRPTNRNNGIHNSRRPVGRR